MHAHRLTGFNKVDANADRRKASSHAGSTGLTGLTGYAGAHMCELRYSNQVRDDLINSLMFVNKRLLTLLTLFKASVHAGFDVTGFAARPVMTCKEA